MRAVIGQTVSPYRLATEMRRKLGESLASIGIALPSSAHDMP